MAIHFSVLVLGSLLFVAHALTGLRSRGESQVGGSGSSSTAHNTTSSGSGQGSRGTIVFCGDEAMPSGTGPGSSLYRGCQTKTRSGRTCQSWSNLNRTRFAPTIITRQGQRLFDPNQNLQPYEGGMLDNACRNPLDSQGEPCVVLRWTLTGNDGTRASRYQYLRNNCQTGSTNPMQPVDWYPGKGRGIWCYTTDESFEWEYCDPLEKPLPIFGPHEWPRGPYVKCGNETLSQTSTPLAASLNYRGCQTKTKSGRTCQSWAAQTPHAHTVASGHAEGLTVQLPGGDILPNPCRNPDYLPETRESGHLETEHWDSTTEKWIRDSWNTTGRGIWCFTTDPSMVWEVCDAPEYPVLMLGL